jgi:two-component system response regulator QseB
MRILLVEDDPMIARAVEKGLVQSGFAIDLVTDGHQADQVLGDRLHSLVVLDLGLPRKDGMAILASLRKRSNPIPVLVISARDTVADRIAALEAGADDYLLKPFDLDELIARIRSVLRRQRLTSAELRNTCARPGAQAGHPRRGRGGPVGA